MKLIALFAILLGSGCAQVPGPVTVMCHDKPVYLYGALGGLAIHENGAYDKCFRDLDTKWLPGSMPAEP